MKSTLTHTMIAVAALAVAAGTASAQTLKAQIPMSFRAGEKSMTAGKYTIEVNRGYTATAVVRISGENGEGGALLLPSAGGDVPKTWLKDGSPRLTFACAAGQCVLAQLWNGEGGSTFRFQHRDLPTIEARGATMVTLAMIKVR